MSPSLSSALPRLRGWAFSLVDERGYKLSVHERKEPEKYPFLSSGGQAWSYVQDDHFRVFVVLHQRGETREWEVVYSLRLSRPSAFRFNAIKEQEVRVRRD